MSCRALFFSLVPHVRRLIWLRSSLFGTGDNVKEQTDAYFTMKLHLKRDAQKMMRSIALKHLMTGRSLLALALDETGVQKACDYFTCAMRMDPSQEEAAHGLMHAQDVLQSMKRLGVMLASASDDESARCDDGFVEQSIATLRQTFGEIDESDLELTPTRLCGLTLLGLKHFVGFAIDHAAEARVILEQYDVGFENAVGASTAIARTILTTSASVLIPDLHSNGVDDCILRVIFGQVLQRIEKERTQRQQTTGDGRLFLESLENIVAFEGIVRADVLAGNMAIGKVRHVAKAKKSPGPQIDTTAAVLAKRSLAEHDSKKGSPKNKLEGWAAGRRNAKLQKEKEKMAKLQKQAEKLFAAEAKNAAQ